jgi:hypothetical protein
VTFSFQHQTANRHFNGSAISMIATFIITTEPVGPAKSLAVHGPACGQADTMPAIATGILKQTENTWLYNLKSGH